MSIFERELVGVSLGQFPLNETSEKRVKEKFSNFAKSLIKLNLAPIEDISRQVKIVLVAKQVIFQLG